MVGLCGFRSCMTVDVHTSVRVCIVGCNSTGAQIWMCQDALLNGRVVGEVAPIESVHRARQLSPASLIVFRSETHLNWLHLIVPYE